MTKEYIMFELLEDTRSILDTSPDPKKEEYEKLNLEFLDWMYNLVGELPEESGEIGDLSYIVNGNKEYYIWTITPKESYIYEEREHILIILPLTPLKLYKQAIKNLKKSRFGNGFSAAFTRKIPKNKKYAVIGVFSNYYTSEELSYTKVVYTSHLSNTF